MNTGRFLGLATVLTVAVAASGMAVFVTPSSAVHTQTALSDISPAAGWEDDTADMAPPVQPAKVDYDGDARLSGDDARRYARIFTLQGVGDWQGADKMADKLDDNRLLGHVLYQRYMSKGYKAGFAELKAWMDFYADQPGADDIYALAAKRRAPGASGVNAPQKAGAGISGRYDIDTIGVPSAYESKKSRSAEQRVLARDAERRVQDWLSRSAPSKALSVVDAASGALDTGEIDNLKADIASAYYFSGKVDKAYALASAASDRSKGDAPLAGWIAGLSAFRAGNFKPAAVHFEHVAGSDRASGWLAAAGAYWAARSHLKAGEPENVSAWLERAAEHPRTFYGLIAVKALGFKQVKYNWSVPDFGSHHEQALAKTKAGYRAMALIDAGQPELAEKELRQVSGRDNDTVKEALVALAETENLPALAMRLGSAVTRDDGSLYDAALYPVSPWQPVNGFEVDPALVFAFIRQESKFDPTAFSPSGAVGLMQLMPATARFVARDQDGLYPPDMKTAMLKDPVVNINLGQKYIGTLLKNDSVGGNQFKLAVAYNAGPGRLARWQNQINYKNDPLLFIESIPAAETRSFVERVLANYWIYRIRLKGATPSLDAVASGEWPLYNDEFVSRQKFADAAAAVDSFFR